MIQEFFDIVDQNNKKTGSIKARNEIHKNLSEWHRATHIWIFNDKQEVLCQRRSLQKDANPGKWQSFFGGHLKAGDNYKESAIKELGEELGITIKISELIPLYVRKSDSAKHFSQVYVLKLNKSINSLHFDKEEVVELSWFTIDKLKDVIGQDKFCNSVDERVTQWIEEK